MANTDEPRDSTGPYHATVFWRTIDALAEQVDHRIGWYHLPKPLGLATLISLRDTLRRKNLYDTTILPSADLPPIDPPRPDQLINRTLDGTYNDLEQPRMGMAGSRFGRNIPLTSARRYSRDEILEPSPREISRALMTRKEFIAATSVNALASAWLQFMIRDWFSHGSSPKDNPWQIELASDDTWPDRPMTIMRVMSDPTRPDADTATPPTFINTSTHWWDASQIYGTTQEYQQFVRSGQDGKLRVEPDGSLPLPPGADGNPTTEPGFWIGLVLLQTLFTHEHNAICDMLRSAYPRWPDEQIFQRARLVVAALIAKIHTTEWTPAVISHPTSVTGLRASWWGVVGERVSRLFGRLSSSEVVSGIPGSQPNHYGVPYALTEEFTAVYRMHPLMPDDWSMRSLADDSLLGDYTLRDLSNPGALAIFDKVSMTDMLYSFGTLHPGIVTLRNFPRFLQEFVRPDRQADGSGRDRHPPPPRAWRAAVQRISPVVASSGPRDVRGADG